MYIVYVVPLIYLIIIQGAMDYYASVDCMSRSIETYCILFKTTYCVLKIFYFSYVYMLS